MQMAGYIPSVQAGLLWLPKAGELLVVSEKEFDTKALTQLQSMPAVAAASAYSLHYQAAFVNFHEGATPIALSQVAHFFHRYGG